MEVWIAQLIGAGLASLGGIILFVLVKRKSYHTSKPDFIEERNEHVEHYTKVRDKIVKAKYIKSAKKSKDDEGGGFSIGSIIGGIVVIVVGLNILPMVNDAIMSVNTSMNPNTQMLTSMIPILFAIGIVLCGVTLAISGLKYAGVM